jgi:hypothetical protein
MAKAKMKVTKKKVNTNKTRKVKATKPKVPKANGNRVRGFGRGYNVELTTRKYNFGNGNTLYEVYEVSGPKVAGRRIFVDEESVKLFIERNEMEVAEDRALAGKTYGGPMARGVIKEMKDMEASKDLPEINTELPDKCDKHSIEDIDA